MKTPRINLADNHKPRFLFCGQVFTGNALPVTGRNHLYIADIATQGHSQLTKGDFDVSSIATSLDLRLAYICKSNLPGGKGDQICSIELASGRSKVLHSAQGPGHRFSDIKVSPDSKQLAMIHTFDGGNGAGGYKRITVLDVKTGKMRSAGRLDDTSTGWDWHGNSDIRVSLADTEVNVSAVSTVCIATGRGEISRSATASTVGSVVPFGKGVSVVTRGAGDITLLNAGKAERKVTISLAMQQRMGFVPNGIALSTLPERVNGRIVFKTASRQNEVTAFGVLDEKRAQIDYWFMSPGHTVFAVKENLAISWRNLPMAAAVGEPATDSGLQWMSLIRTDRWTTILRNQVSVAGYKIILLG